MEEDRCRGEGEGCVAAEDQGVLGSGEEQLDGGLIVVEAEHPPDEQPGEGGGAVPGDHPDAEP